MNIGPDVTTQLHRLGNEATVLVPTEAGENAFGNPQNDYAEDRTVYAVRTYPNRNTTIESASGDMTTDRPVFLFPKSESEPDPPQPEDHLRYNGRVYEMQSPTHYETHVEFFGEYVRH